LRPDFCIPHSFFPSRLAKDVGRSASARPADKINYCNS